MSVEQHQQQIHLTSAMHMIFQDTYVNLRDTLVDFWLFKVFVLGTGHEKGQTDTTDRMQSVKQRPELEESRLIIPNRQTNLNDFQADICLSCSFSFKRTCIPHD